MAFGIDFERLVTGFSEVLSQFFRPAPASLYFDVVNAAAATAPAAGDVQVVSYQYNGREGLVLSGFATSPTLLQVRYTLFCNGEPFYQCACQPSATLWELQALSSEFRKGPLLLEIRATSTTGAPIAGVYARLAGWVIAGGGLKRGHLVRGE